MSGAKQRKIGSVIGYIYTVVHSLISIIYIPILINDIGKGEYGLYQIMGSIIAYFSVMESPLSASVLRYYSYYKEHNDKICMENTLAIGRRIFNILNGVFLLTIIPGMAIIKLVHASSLTGVELTEACWMFCVMMVNLIISAKSFVYIAAINANEQYIFLKASSIIMTVLQPIGVIFVIKKFPYALSIVTIQVILNSFLYIIRKVYATKKLGIVIKFHKKDNELLFKMFKLSMSVMLISLADQIFWKTGQLIIGALSGTEAVAVYSIGMQFNNIFINVGCVLSSMILPLAVRIDKDDDEKNTGLYALFVRFGRYQSFLVCMMLSGFVLFGKELIFILSDESFDEAYYVAIFMMIPYAIDLIQNSGYIILQVKDKYYIRSGVMLVVAILNIALTIILVPKIGIIGAAISSMLTILIGSGIVMNFVYKKVLFFKIGAFWRSMLRIFAIAISSVFVGVLISRISIGNQYIQFIVHCGMFAILYVIMMYLFAMEKQEKGIVHQIVKKAILKVGLKK